MTEQTETQRRIVEAIRKQIHKAPHEAIVEPLAVKFERALEMTSRHCDLHMGDRNYGEPCNLCVRLEGLPVLESDD